MCIRDSNNAIGEGSARIAFYVDENGQASEYFAFEYSNEAFANELMKVLPKWKFNPAHRFGEPVKRVCRIHWEFRPDRPITSVEFFDIRKRIKKGDDHALRFSEEKKLDAKPRMLVFPEVVAPRGFDASKLRDGKIAVNCEFYLDTEGSVVLPVIMKSAAPELDEQFEEAFRQAVFERPLVNRKPTTAFLNKTYLVSVRVE